MVKEPTTFSDDRQYRYTLGRVVGESDRLVTFILLNPSIADEVVDDPTIRRCISFARTWGYGQLSVVNLFAYRSTNPRLLMTADDPVGPCNDDTILAAVSEADLVVCAWGTNGALHGRGDYVRNLIDGLCRPHVLLFTKHGHPRHPLYIGKNTKPTLWKA